MAGMQPIIKIVSGGQTGADRAGLDWAISVGIPHGGWCPKGRKAEDGPIAGHYDLTEARSENYLQRTEWNVRDSDGTAIFTMRATLSGGSKKTADFAGKHGKPYLHLTGAESYEQASRRLREFIAMHGIRVLNVAGSRGSKEPEVGAFVRAVLSAAISAQG